MFVYRAASGQSHAVVKTVPAVTACGRLVGSDEVRVPNDSGVLCAECAKAKVAS